VLKVLLRRVRGFMMAEVMAELAEVKAELRRRDAALEAVLLTIALNAPVQASPSSESSDEA
jgi:hypothetical protein